MDRKQLGTNIDEDGNTYVYVGLNKDKEKQERTNYKDKFLSPTKFQWESQNDVSLNSERGKKLLNTKTVHLFVRKMDSEDNVSLPFTYFGSGKFVNPRESYVQSIVNGKTIIHKTILFDILLDNPVDETYYFDFEIPEGESN